MIFNPKNLKMKTQLLSLFLCQPALTFFCRHELQFINVIAAITTPHRQNFHKDDDNTNPHSPIDVIGSQQVHSHGFEKTPKLAPQGKLLATNPLHSDGNLV